MMKAFASLLVMVAVLTQGGLATAQSLTPAINFDADNPVTGWLVDRYPVISGHYWQPLQTHGWSFRLSEPALLTHLAMYDLGSDGLQNDFRVGIWGEIDPIFVDGESIRGPAIFS